MPPHLTFACELAASELTALFEDGTVIDHLVALKASVALGLLDLSAERAAVVSRLNLAGIPVIAWLLLPTDQGYWFNMNNAAFAIARYRDFRTWSADHDLRWDGVGIDLEPDTREIQRALADRWSLLPTIMKRLFDDEARKSASREYAQLYAQIRGDGFRVQSYAIPFIEDEDIVGASLLHRVFGMVDVHADIDVPMLYTSFAGDRGVAMLWSYGKGKQEIFVGSTGGGVAIAGIDQVPPLTWDGFERDLRLANRLTDKVSVFSLEGCVRQGFLERLRDFDWAGPVEIPTVASATIDRGRAAARAGLWATAHPRIVLGTIIGLAMLRRVLFSRRAR